MYPITVRELSLADSAEHWSREIVPSRPWADVLDFLVNAWMSGKLQGDGPDRLTVCRSVFRLHREEFRFDDGSHNISDLSFEHDDGSVAVDMRPFIRVPSFDVTSWSDNACQDTFLDMADGLPKVGHVYDLILPAISGIRVQRAEFFQFVVGRRYHAPNFWGEPPSQMGQLAATSPVVVVTPGPKPGESASDAARFERKARELANKYISDTVYKHGAGAQIIVKILENPEFIGRDQSGIRKMIQQDLNKWKLSNRIS